MLKEEGILTQVMGIRQLVVADTNRKEPNQSNDRSFVTIEPSFGFSRRHTGMPTAAITQNGILSQKIHLQETFSAKAPPITGPITIQGLKVSITSSR
jgi:hypothetical protein